MITSKDKYIKTSGLIIDARSITQLIYINAVFGKLKEVGYNDYLSIEYVHQNYMMTVYDDVLSETIKMRDLYNTWKGK